MQGVWGFFGLGGFGLTRFRVSGVGRMGFTGFVRFVGEICGWGVGFRSSGSIGVLQGFRTFVSNWFRVWGFGVKG